MALSEEEAQSVRLTLASTGWTNIIAPTIENRGREAIKALTLSRTERAAAYKGTDFDTDDDVLRATIRFTKWIMTSFSKAVEVAEFNRRRDELDRQDSNAPVTN